ncbi:MAG: formylglycine-generating enzyme family protein, partial [Proteobacteria bacterium]|nr:formylglycine-generating enzyme family protein [Pseudomonadota bacterium]
ELPDPLQDTFVRRWYAAADPPNAEAKAGGLLVHLQEREDLAELRRNPMLLTALCVMYDQGQRLPQDFYKLYDAVVGQVLYKRYLTENERDRARYRLEAVALGMHLGRHSGMDRRNPDFRDATDTSHPLSPSSVAANRNDGGCLDSSALRNTPAAEVDIDEILCHLADYQRNDPTTESGSSDARQAREDLLSNSGLLLPRPDGRAAFYHLSFQEFLAAVRLKRIGHSIADVLDSHASTPAWRRSLTFLFGTIADKDSPKAALDALGHLLPKLEPKTLEQDPNPALLFADCLEVAHGRGWNLERFAKPLRQACDHALLHLNPPERAHLWKALGRLGWDDRLGVGVNEIPPAPLLQRGVGGIYQACSGLPLPDMDWVDIPEGPFRYGDKKTNITLPAFKIARYPVTNSQYQCFIDDGGYEDGRWWQGLAENPLPSGEGRVRAERGRWNGPNQPRETVSWYEAVAYTRWLTAKLQAHGLIPEGMTVRLPTEQEWEKSARGNDGREFPWGEEYLSGRANIDETWDRSGTLKLGQTTTVGIYPLGVSPYGVLDMVGNVWEWCLNEYDRRGIARVVRGGAWLDDRGFARCAVRSRSQPDDRDHNGGFRVVVVLCSAPVL